ncbi:hypothetical protein AB6A40_007784 [Gnathostoma spinigerum]|uniref:Uncharacterized protein n=1 Tax=Gnathostoma spinigerum TaxID=75299 RepID=A0ABD6EXV2_9BILA
MITTSEMVDSRDDNSPKTKEYAHTMANASKSDLELASNGTMNTIIPKATDHQLPLFAEHLHIDDPVSESALCSSDVAVSSFSSHAIIGFAGSSSDFASIDQESGNTEGSVSSSSIKLGQEEAGTVGEAVQEEENRDDEDDDGYGSTSTSKGLGFQMNRRYGDAAPDCDELRVLLAKALDEQKCNARCLIRRFRLSGVGELINHLRVTGGEIAGIKERIVLDRFGNKILRSSQSEDVPMTWSAHKKSSKSEDGSLKNSFLSRVPAIFRPSDDGSHSDLPPPPPHPADPIEVRLFCSYFSSNILKAPNG